MDTFPFPYHANMTCQFSFSAPAGYLIYVELPFIALEGNGTRPCDEDVDDVLRIPLAGGSERLVCGRPTDRGATLTGLNSVQLTFVSDEDEERGSGFSGFFFSYPNSGKRHAHAISLDGFYFIHQIIYFALPMTTFVLCTVVHYKHPPY